MRRLPPDKHQALGTASRGLHILRRPGVCTCPANQFLQLPLRVCRLNRRFRLFFGDHRVHVLNVREPRQQ